MPNVFEGISALEEITALCARTLRTGSLVLHGAPAAAGWIVGWLASELGPYLHGSDAPDAVLDDALRAAFGPNYRAAIHHPLEPYTAARPRIAAVAEVMLHRRRYATTTTNIPYGPGGKSNLLDIWRRPDLPADGRAPVLIQIPGGGWSINGKRGQGYPLMSRMVELGWICVSINYSRSPFSTWPAHIIDVKRAIAWVRANIAEHGGDPDFIAVTGGSAGGHLCSLAALTPEDRHLQPGFEDADTSVQAAVPHYGVYDFTDHGAMHTLMMPLLEHLVMQARLDDKREMFEAASPTHRAHRDAPPFFILHGDNDALVPHSQAQGFRAALDRVGARTVAYAEIPDAPHLFDALATVRCQTSAEAVAAFLGVVYGRHVSGQSRQHSLAVSTAS